MSRNSTRSIPKLPSLLLKFRKSNTVAEYELHNKFKYNGY